jgi:hypothetical protein
MISRAVLSFEFRRSVRTFVSRRGLASLFFGSALIVVLMFQGLGPSREFASRDLLFVLGAALSSLAAVYTIDRNKRSSVEDVWFALEPQWRPQTGSLFLAWLPVAFCQGLVASLFVLVARAGSDPSDLPGLFAGFVAGLPLGALLSALARLVPGFSLLAGVIFFGVVMTARALSTLLPAMLARDIFIPVLIYLLVSIGGFVLLTRASGRIG